MVRNDRKATALPFPIVEPRARYVPLSFWLAWVGDAFEWALALV